MKNGSSYHVVVKMFISIAVMFAFGSTALESNALDRVLADYNAIGVKFIRDCKDIDQANPPNGERMKYCLTISKELLEKLTTFHKRIEELVRQIKIGGKWDAKLDQQFAADPARYGADATLANLVRQAGGIRSFIERSVTELVNLKPEFATEVREFEAKVRLLGSAPAANGSSRVRVTKVAVKVIYIAQTSSLAANAACSMSGLCAR